MTDGIQNFDFNLTDVGLNSATLAPRNQVLLNHFFHLFLFQNKQYFLAQGRISSESVAVNIAAQTA